jgi:hypothetical protein
VGGLTIKCKAREHINGLMVEYTRVNIMRIRNMGTVSTSGLMARYTKDHGRRGSNTARESR